MSESLKQKTAKGLFWGALNSGSTQVLNLVIGVCLARMLTDADYGIVGVLTIFTAIAGDLQSAGFTQGLVNIKHPTRRDYNSVFSFNVLMSALMYAVLFFCAPLIAAFFRQPCLVEVSRVVFLTFVIASLGIAHGGYMTKNMMNREMAIIGGVALLSSGTVGITLAFLGKGYWALAWQQIAYIGVLNLGRYHYVREWRPRLTLDFGPVREMAPFALKILVTKIINTVSGNVLTFIFGRIFPIGQVGCYSQAYKWDTMANSLVSNTVGQIAQAVLVEAAPDAPETSTPQPKTSTLQPPPSNLKSQTFNRQLRVYRKMLRFTCFLSMPLMLGLALVSREFILLTIGAGWASCVPLLQALCISGAFMPVYTMYQNLAISQGRSGVYMWLNVWQIVLQVAVILCCHRYGMYAMVCAYSAFMVVWLLPWHGFAGRLIGYRWVDVLKDMLPFVLAAAAVMVATHYATLAIVSLPLLLAARVLLAAVLYYLLMKLAGVEILKECETFVMKKF